VSKGLLLGVGLLVWNTVVVTAAVLLVSGSQGENLGKFVGTVFSAIAFVPPAIIVWRVWQRKAAEDAARLAAVHDSAVLAPADQGPRPTEATPDPM
jgi:hypothetical protein